MRKTLGAALVALAAIHTAPAAAQDAYTVGVSAAMTGPGAGIYAPVVEAMRIYIDHVNSRGGVNGKQVRLVVLDDGAEPSRAAANAKKLTQDNVLMLVNSSLSFAIVGHFYKSKTSGVAGKLVVYNFSGAYFAILRK